MLPLLPAAKPSIRTEAPPMCNACGFLCCGSDQFSRCGCDGCEESDCWSDDNDFEDRDSEYPDDGFDFACVETTGLFSAPRKSCCLRALDQNGGEHGGS